MIEVLQHVAQNPLAFLAGILMGMAIGGVIACGAFLEWFNRGDR